MVEDTRTRLEIAFEGQQVLSVHVPAAVADDLDNALLGEADGSFTFDADDGRYTLLLRRIVFVKRYERESRVGFGAIP